MRFLLSILVGATFVTAASAVGSEAEAATTPGIGTLPLQSKTYTPVEKAGYRRRYYRRGYYGYGGYHITAMATDARIMATPTGHTVITATDGDQVSS